MRASRDLQAARRIADKIPRAPDGLKALLRRRLIAQLLAVTRANKKGQLRLV